VVLWHIAPLLSKGQYFFRSRDITWGYHVEIECSGKTMNLTCFWDFDNQTMGACDMDLGHQIWEWLIGGLSHGGVASAKSGCGWQGLGINNVVD